MIKLLEKDIRARYRKCSEDCARRVRESDKNAHYEEESARGLEAINNYGEDSSKGNKREEGNTREGSEQRERG